jgi:hypothetical protein
LLCSDGVWGALDNQRICGLLIAHPDAQQAAASLTSLALASGGQDNASAVVLRVAELPAEKLRDSLEGTARLPLPPRFKPGQSFDGLRIDEVLHDSRATLLYRVTDQLSGQPTGAQDAAPGTRRRSDEIRALIMEEWRSRRIVSPFFAQLLPLKDAAASTICRAGTRERRCSGCLMPICTSPSPKPSRTVSG